MRRISLLAVVGGTALALAACSDPVPQLTFEGVSVVDGVDHELELTLVRSQDALTGEYLVQGAGGSFDGTVSGETVEAVLTPSATCSYSFDGTLTENSLDGTFEPTDCPGGQTGSWDLERR